MRNSHARLAAIRILHYIDVYTDFLSRHHCPLDVGFDRGYSSAVARGNFAGKPRFANSLDIYWTTWTDFHRQV